MLGPALVYSTWREHHPLSRQIVVQPHAHQEQTNPRYGADLSLSAGLCRRVFLRRQSAAPRFVKHQGFLLEMQHQRAPVPHRDFMRVRHAKRIKRTRLHTESAERAAFQMENIIVQHFLPGLIGAGGDLNASVRADLLAHQARGAAVCLRLRIARHGQAAAGAVGPDYALFGVLHGYGLDQHLLKRNAQALGQAYERIPGFLKHGLHGSCLTYSLMNYLNNTSTRPVTIKFKNASGVKTFHPRSIS